jgi:leucyl aminopeptidase
MDNAVARKEGHAEKLQKDSESVGDPFEISTIRREDYQFHRGDKKFTGKFSVCFYKVVMLGKGEAEDVLQCNNKPSSQTARGHQGPAAFLVLTSGLDKVISRFLEKFAFLVLTT